MKRLSLATLLLTFALTAAVGCSKDKQDAAKSDNTSATTTNQKVASSSEVATAKLLIMKFHHDS